MVLARDGGEWAREHSGQEPTVEPRPHPQDAHAQGPGAVVSQPQLHGDSGVNLNHTLPHGGLAGRRFYRSLLVS